MPSLPIRIAIRTMIRIATPASLLCIAGCAVPNGTNINEREAFWRSELTPHVQPGVTTKSQLEQFLKTKGQTLECYQNREMKDQCDFTDGESHGGTSNMSMKLVVIFEMNGETVASQSFATAHADASE